MLKEEFKEIKRLTDKVALEKEIAEPNSYFK